VTCIVGVTDGERTIIGGDSAGLAGWSITTRNDPKVFRLGPLAVGFTSSFRMGQLLRYMELDADNIGDVDRWMVTSFVPQIRALFREGGFTRTELGVESGGAFLVGHAGRLFEISTDFQVGESTDGYAAVGCGFAEALGALHVTRGVAGLQWRAEVALDTAAYLNAGVRGPYNFEEAG
jgi:hypothetical protein